MRKRSTEHRVYVELTAVWGNDDAASTIKVSRRRWQAICAGGEYVTSAWSWYEGRRCSVTWEFANGKVSVYGGGGGQCVNENPLCELIVETNTPG
jgi:hypothetical protein